MSDQNQAWMALAGVALVGAASSLRRARGSRVKGVEDEYLACLQVLNAVPAGSFVTELTPYQRKVWVMTGRLVCPHGLEVLQNDLSVGWGAMESEGNREVQYPVRDDSENVGESWYECGHGVNADPKNLVPSIRSLVGPKSNGPHEQSLKRPDYPARKGRLYYWFDEPDDLIWL